MKLRGAVAAGSAVLLLVMGAAQGAGAAASLGGTNTWTVVGSATPLTLQGSPAWQMTFHNALSTSVMGVVILVLHNGLGQTVYYSTGTITLPSLGVGSVYVLVVGVPSGSYNATFFAFDPSGVAISAPTSGVFVVG